MFIAKKKTSLKSPPRNFGSTPDSGEMFSYLVIFGMVSFFTPLFVFPLFGLEVSHHGRLTSGAIASMVATFILISVIAGKKFWLDSLRMHYLMTELVPFLETRYRISLFRRTIRDVIRGRSLTTDKDGNSVVFVDWEIIEEEARNPTGKDLTNEVFLMVELPDGTYREFTSRK